MADRRLAKRLERLRSRLRLPGALRVRFGGGWYWVLEQGVELGDVFEV